jgi:PAS domain S-box-containing protein
MGDNLPSDSRRGAFMPDARLTLPEYEALVEQSPILIWRANTEASCDYFNDRWLSFRGRSMEQEHGNGWAEGVHPDDFQRCLEMYLDNFKARKAFEMEYRLMRYDGEYRWIFDRGVPFNDDKAQFAGFIGSCIDVTERVEAQEALRVRLENEIKTLKGIIPICGYCKKIRDDQEIWQHLETYISDHTDALFTHGICPNCLDEQMGKMKKTGRPAAATGPRGGK